MSLIEQARQNQTARIQAEQAQQEADKTAQGMRFASERLLRTGGERTNQFADDTTARPFAKSLARFMLATVYAPVAPFRGLTPFEMVDYRKIEKDIQPEQGDPVKVTMSSDYADPEKSPRILVKVKGLDEALVLRSDHGEIYKWGSVTTGDGVFEDFKDVQKWIPDRWATPEDITQWKRDVIDPLVSEKQEAPASR